jgi:transposase
MSSINQNQYVRDYDHLVEQFCFVDDFCQKFNREYEKHLLSSGKIIRLRCPGLSPSEIMTIMIEFHSSRYADFKAYYLEYVLVHLRSLFPGLVSYNRFVELLPRVMIPLMWLTQMILAPCTGISFVDSTVMRICHIKRLFNHKVFRGIAKHGKSTMGWFFGFKLHLVISEEGNLISCCLTPGNVDDRTPLSLLTKKLFGKLFADKGYISLEWFAKLYAQGVKLVTGVKSNMKNKFIPLMEKIYLRKRSIIETINDWLKNVCHIEHTRHRSPTNFLVNLYSGLIAYQLTPKKPKIRFTSSELSFLPAVA